MLLYRKSCLVASALMLSFSLAACEKQGGEGAAERAGTQVDKAVDQAGQALDKAKQSVVEAGKEVAK